MGLVLLRDLSRFYVAILMATGYYSIYLKDNLQIKGSFWNSKSGIHVAEVKQKQDAANCNIRDSKVVEE